MGKPAMLFLAAALCLAAPTSRAEADPEGEGVDSTAVPEVTSGKFLTAEDLAHIEAALGYIDLTPQDLSFEKKLIDHRLRLSVVDRALDRPLELPGIAERSADLFGAHLAGARRSVHAGELLDLDKSRWSHDETLKDAEELALRFRKLDELSDMTQELTGEAELNRIQKQREEALKELESFTIGRVLGDDAQAILDPEGDDEFSPFFYRLAESLCVKLHAVERAEREDTAPDRERLAAIIASSLISEQPLSIPGGRIDPFYDTTGLADDVMALDLAESFELPGKLVAHAQLSAWLEAEAARWSTRLNFPVLDEELSGKPVEVEGVTGNIYAAWQGDRGKIVIGGTGPNTYQGDDFIAIIDLGGDDTYRGRVASGIGMPGHSAVSFVLDMGGDDRYLGEDFTQGFGFLGVGILWDLGGGDDTYKSRFCAQGMGLCGAGELHDDGGDDSYLADSGAQGAAAFGYGQLFDNGGNDNYRGARFVQGFAQVKGVGVLTDNDGNDSYFAGGKYLHEPLFNDRYQSLSQGFAIG
ncbi:MAG: hypothetical protein OEY28_10620, partial [Nitrospira sp.]|nr:hypothetical protein [Nitrospira sp.]